MSWITNIFCKDIKKLKTKIAIQEQLIQKSEEVEKVIRDNIESLNIQLEGQKLLNTNLSKKLGYTFNVDPIMYDKPCVVTKAEIQNIVQATYLTSTDAYFYGIDKLDVQRIMNDNPQIADAQYLKNDYDCDNFANAMHGLFNQPTLGRFAFGWAVSKNHAFNFFIDRNKVAWIVEPQSNKIMSIEEAEAEKLDYKIIKYLI